MIKVKVNEQDLEVEEGLTVLQACEKQELKFQDSVTMKNFP